MGWVEKTSRTTIVSIEGVSLSFFGSSSRKPMPMGDRIPPHRGFPPVFGCDEPATALVCQNTHKDGRVRVSGSDPQRAGIILRYTECSSRLDSNNKAGERRWDRIPK
mmetsp:Transcript_43587/g.51044  ORF Transcript_43587/g.51044 Transcript_43587/m.51044 type:complete len:107 (-) Transcript_43587:77-397(-)